MSAVDDLQGFASQLRDCDDPFSLFQTYIMARDGAGYFYAFAGMKSDMAEFNFSNALFSHHTYGAAWDAISSDKPSIDDDPTTRRMLAGEDFIEWVPENMEYYAKDLSPAQLKHIDAEHRLGMKFGCTIALDRSALGISGIGIWTGGVTTIPEFRHLWDRVGREIVQGATMLDLHVRNEKPNLLIGLTPREIDCISWLATGLRPSEICWKLKISEKTFEKHIANAKVKLKARTRDNAVAKSILFGLISV